MQWRLVRKSMLAEAAVVAAAPYIRQWGWISRAAKHCTIYSYIIRRAEDI